MNCIGLLLVSLGKYDLVDNVFLFEGGLYGMLKHMGILEQYEKQFPEANKPTPQWQPSSEYGFWVRLVMKLSGGRIQDEKIANYVLLGAVLLLMVIAIMIFFFGSADSVSIHNEQIQVQQPLFK